MARKRQISPEFFTDEDIAEMSIHCRLLYIGIWIHCEDTGVIEAKSRKLKVQIFPYDEVNVEPLYEELTGMNKIIEYEVNEKIYGFVKSFHKWQKIQHPSQSYLPLPPATYRDLIPENIRLQNKYRMVHEDSLRDTVGLNEDEHRIEENRIEKNISEKNINVCNAKEKAVSKDEIELFKQYKKSIYPNAKVLLKYLSDRNLSINEQERVIREVYGAET